MFISILFLFSGIGILLSLVEYNILIFDLTRSITCRTVILSLELYSESFIVILSLNSLSITSSIFRIISTISSESHPKSSPSFASSVTSSGLTAACSVIITFILFTTVLRSVFKGTKFEGAEFFKSFLLDPKPKVFKSVSIFFNRTLLLFLSLFFLSYFMITITIKLIMYIFIYLYIY